MTPKGCFWSVASLAAFKPAALPPCAHRVQTPNLAPDKSGTRRRTPKPDGKRMGREVRRFWSAVSHTAFVWGGGGRLDRVLDELMGRARLKAALGAASLKA